MKEVYIVRHGETEWARDEKHTGLTDISLTETGEIQAAALARRIERIKFSHIFSSPLKRAKETCAICGFDPKIDKDLLEWDYGAYEGMTSKEILKTMPDWTIFTHGAPGGESIDDTIKRADRFIKKVESLEGKIAIFSSGHFLRTLTMRWLEIPLQNGTRFALFTASLSILSYEKNTRAVKLWNDVSHIE
ncbi:MAG: histidine phosphatase family protein [Simkaniaceae bacterium]|nr:histidine phosphatase family protein [Simkaniaceae bacterium]